MKMDGYVQAQCDFGNPSGSGLAKIAVPSMVVEDYATAQTKLGTYHAALVTAQLTGSAKGDQGNTFVSESAAARPGASINADRKLVAMWRTTGDSTPRRHTISGVPATSTGISLEDAGERLNTAGKAALATALEAVYGLGVGEVVILSGKVIQKT